MRVVLIIIILLFSVGENFAQEIVFGKIISRSSGDPVSFAQIESSTGQMTYSNILGEFELEVDPSTRSLKISRRGYFSESIKILPGVSGFYSIELSGKRSELTGDILLTDELKANQLIEEAIENKYLNDPKQALESYSYASYNKLLIDKQRVKGDSLIWVNGSSPDSGRSFLSEKISEIRYKKNTSPREYITGLKIHGIEEAVYEILTLHISPASIYEDKYPLYGIPFAGPLGKSGLKNYKYKLLDTVNISGRPGYVIHYKPRRPKVVPGWEGLIFLDATTRGVQRSLSQYSAEIHMEIEENYTFLKNENIWFPLVKNVALKPGSGGKDITVFGASISTGTVQRKKSILNWVISTGDIEEDLEMISTTFIYNINLNTPVDISRGDAAIIVEDSATIRQKEFWDVHRFESLDDEDKQTAQNVSREIEQKNIIRKTEILHTLLTGFYPVEFWNFDLGKLVKFNNFEGFRLGVGGITNQNVSRRFRLEGYIAYGFKDESYKYGVGGGALLIKRSGTWWNLKYNQDLREIAVNEYIKNVKDFAILEPRKANISSYYAYKTLETGLEHRITPQFETELLFSRSEISQLGNYAFLKNGEVFSDYTLVEVKVGFLWRLFSNFISTPDFHRLYEKGYPVITAQLTQALTGPLEGDLGYTKLGLKAVYQVTRLNRSTTQITMEANYGHGDLPLTHAFHAFPNNPLKEKVIQRFSVAGKIAFETMYFDEFFSDKQAAIHIRHQLRKFVIIPAIQPDLSIISRHVIGDFKNKNAHQNIEFKTLENLYSEAGLELNNIFAGIGLSAAYRYGAYHLPNFSNNFSFKFTFELKI